MDYKNLGLKVGLEFHQRLDTHKLFCNCDSDLEEEHPYLEVMRKLRPVAGELGKVDAAAMQEFVKRKTFDYQVFHDEVCLVELDEEPPMPLNNEALNVALTIALMLKCDIVDEIHVMRKTVIDGSNTSGFQRTAMIAHSGVLKTEHGDVEIEGVFLEEEASGIIGKKEKGKYRLDRLGIPLIEVSTGIMKLEPKQIKDVALKLGTMVRMTGRVKRGLGTIRQDVNVSIKKGARCEIKGVQDLRILDKVIENEVNRQLDLVKKNKKVAEETRNAKPDGTSVFMRPLAGSARMYPETDCSPVVVTDEHVSALKKSLPEEPEKVLHNLKTKYKLSDELAMKILTSKHLPLFYDITRLMLDSTFVASTFLNTLTMLRREGVNVAVFTKEHFHELFSAVKQGKLPKEAVPDVLRAWAKTPAEKLVDILKIHKISMVSEKEIQAKTKEFIKKRKDLLSDKRRAFKVLMADLMKEFKGKAEGSTIAKILKKELS
jgi:Glu-tRNA(Gln) amidotransferase subunit E-like FAD-binding protein